MSNASRCHPPSAKAATNFDSHIGSRIRLRRSILSISQNELASAIGVSFQQMQKYEIGENRISASRLYHISIMLDAPVQWFFDEVADALPIASNGSTDLRDSITLIKDFLQIKDTALRDRLLRDASRFASKHANSDFEETILQPGCATHRCTNSKNSRRRAG